MQMAHNDKRKTVLQVESPANVEIRMEVISLFIGWNFKQIADMTAFAFGIIGGVGLFLLGMMLLTDGLKSFAGDHMRLALLRYTGSPAKAFMSGALVTALVQSSSATTVTVIGFVSAGVLAFAPAVSVVMGASLGTTGTGWLVSVLGLKISIGFYALPLIGAGAFMRLLGRGRWRSLGLALAGFGIIFIGIETLQRSMEGLSSFFTLSDIPATGFLGHVLAMLIGLVMTVVMQSSSAAVATTLTALHTGSISFDQASSLVIGAAIGTTITGALAAIGGSVPAKRTALAHILFNSATGVVAIVLLPLFLYVIGLAQKHLGLDPGAVSLAAFHTLFIGVGVLIFLPFTGRFARWIERLLPEQVGDITRHLDASLLSVPAIALEAVRRAIAALAVEIALLLRDDISGRERTGSREKRVQQIMRDMQEIRSFFSQIPLISEGQPMSELRVDLIHAVDHLQRMGKYVQPTESVRETVGQERLDAMRSRVQLIVEKVEACAGHLDADTSVGPMLREDGAGMIALAEEERATIIREAAEGTWDSQTATRLLDTIRWYGRVGNHLARIMSYLQGSIS